MTKQYQSLTHTGPGTQSLTFGWEDFIKGQSTSINTMDGGFASDSTATNLLVNRGTITPSALPVNITSNLPGSYLGFAATCPSSEGGSFSQSAYLRAVDTLGDLYIYASTGVWTQPAFDSGSNTYDNIHSDMCFFNGSYYVSTANQGLKDDDVTQWTGTSTVVSDWFSSIFGHSLKRNVVHSLIVFNKSLYIADGNLLHKWDGTNFVYAVLTLTSEANITALSIDPQSGRLMVAYTQSAGFSEAPTIAKIGLYDGTNPTQFIKVCIIDDISFCIYPLGGQVFVFYGNNLGIWNDNGVTFIRDGFGPDTGLKQRVTNIGNDLFFVNGTSIMCYSEVLGGGQKVFFNISTDNNISGYLALFYLDGGTSSLGYSANNSGTLLLKSFGILGSGSSSSITQLNTNHYFFPRRAYIRAIDIMIDPILASGETITPTLVTDIGSTIATTPTQMTSSMQRTTRFDFQSIPTTYCKLKLAMATASSLRQVVIYYELAE